METKGIRDGKLQVSTNCKLKIGDFTIWKTHTPNKVMRISQVVEMPVRSKFNSNCWMQYMNIDGTAIFKLKLVILEPDVLSMDLHINQFKQSSFEQMRKNLAGLLADKKTADFKIRTSDDKEVLVHKAILKGILICI